jgi:DNA-binding MarR family transcriptional regulator
VDDLSLALALARAASGMRRRLEVQGLSFREYAVLHHLLEAPDRQLRRIDLVDLLGLTPSGVARLLAPLEKQEYVTRRPDPQDARRALVALTEAGEARAHEARAVAADKTTALLDRALDASDRQALAGLLDRLTRLV